MDHANAVRVDPSAPSSWHTEYTRVIAATKCSLCDMTLLRATTSTSCGHVFCEACVNAAIEQRPNPRLAAVAKVRAAAAGDAGAVASPSRRLATDDFVESLCRVHQRPGPNSDGMGDDVGAAAAHPSDIGAEKPQKKQRRPRRKRELACPVCGLPAFRWTLAPVAPMEGLLRVWAALRAEQPPPPPPPAAAEPASSLFVGAAGSSGSGGAMMMLPTADRLGAATPRAPSSSFARRGGSNAAPSLRTPGVVAPRSASGVDVGDDDDVTQDDASWQAHNAATSAMTGAADEHQQQHQQQDAHQQQQATPGSGVRRTTTLRVVADDADDASHLHFGSQVVEAAPPLLPPRVDSSSDATTTALPPRQLRFDDRGALLGRDSPAAAASGASRARRDPSMLRDASSLAAAGGALQHRSATWNPSAETGLASMGGSAVITATAGSAASVAARSLSRTGAFVPGATSVAVSGETPDGVRSAGSYAFVALVDGALSRDEFAVVLRAASLVGGRVVVAGDDPCAFAAPPYPSVTHVVTRLDVRTGRCAADTCVVAEALATPGVWLVGVAWAEAVCDQRAVVPAGRFEAVGTTARLNIPSLCRAGASHSVRAQCRKLRATVVCIDPSVADVGVHIGSVARVLHAVGGPFVLPDGTPCALNATRRRSDASDDDDSTDDGVGSPAAAGVVSPTTQRPARVVRLVGSVSSVAAGNHPLASLAGGHTTTATAAAARPGGPRGIPDAQLTTTAAALLGLAAADMPPHVAVRPVSWLVHAFTAGRVL